MDENSTPPPAPHGGWWFAWIIATVIIPGSALVLITLIPETWRFSSPALRIAGGATLLLHLIASVELAKEGSALKPFMLVVGGWLLMAVSLYASCSALIR